jgi:hypothetical protein
MEGLALRGRRGIVFPCRWCYGSDHGRQRLHILVAGNSVACHEFSSYHGLSRAMLRLLRSPPCLSRIGYRVFRFSSFLVVTYFGLFLFVAPSSLSSPSPRVPFPTLPLPLKSYFSRSTSYAQHLSCQYGPLQAPQPPDRDHTEVRLRSNRHAKTFEPQNHPVMSGWGPLKF